MVASPTGPTRARSVVLQTPFARIGVFRWAWRGSEDANAMGDPLARWVDLSLIEELVYMSKSADTNNKKKELPYSVPARVCTANCNFNFAPEIVFITKN